MKQSKIMASTTSNTYPGYPQPSMGFPTDLCIYQGWRMLPLCIHLIVTTPAIIKTVLLPRLVVQKWMSCLPKPHLITTHTQPMAREMGKMTGFWVTSSLTKRIRTIFVFQFTPMCSIQMHQILKPLIKSAAARSICGASWDHHHLTHFTTCWCNWITPDIKRSIVLLS